MAFGMFDPATREKDRVWRSNKASRMMVKGLFDALPEPGEVMTVDYRRRWMEAANAIFDYVFEEEPEVKP
jgi:hypothetical protein